ncbi:hypothetical protein VTO42DRAFT_3668 [Malbranchea cinnamomea]
MAQNFKLKDISASDLKDGDKIEAQVDGVEGGSVLVVRLNGQIHAMTAKCTHYGAPLMKGVLTPDGRITCPWHGACFKIETGDVEDAPAPNGLIKFDVFEKDGSLFIKGDEASIKASGRPPVGSCSVEGNDHVVIVGGGSGTFGAVESLRENGYKGRITVISREPYLPVDRPKLSKALIADANKIAIRSKDWYSAVSIDTIFDEVTGVDFNKKTVSTASGKTHSYTKLILATGGIPRQLPLPGFKELGNIFVLRYVTDVQKILEAVGDKNKNIVIIGSSFIGMEVGNALAKENKVTIVGMESAPLERVMGYQVGRIFQSNLEKSGLKFHMSASVEKATPSESDPSKVGAVHLKDGTVLLADLVILGVGVRPATDFLKDNPSITLEKDGSIKTDESFAVAGLNDVYAVGDIVTYPYHGPSNQQQGTQAYVRIEHWNVAQNAGRSVGRSIASNNTIRPKPFIPIFWSALGAQLRYCGNAMNGYDDIVMRGKPENANFAAFYTAGDKVVAVASMGMDPLNTKCAELMRRGRMPSKKDLLNGVDVLALDLPGKVAI